MCFKIVLKIYYRMIVYFKLSKSFVEGKSDPEINKRDIRTFPEKTNKF